MNDKIVICDFDGTITKHDSLDLFLNKYADESWHEFEKLWMNGEIGSRECIRKQFDLISHMDSNELYSFLRSVELDECFSEFYTKAKAQNIKVAIVSDGFDLFIENILKNYGITDIEIHTNHLEFENGEFLMEFPNVSNTCKKHSGTCKCKIVDEFKKNYQTVFYVGDGISDFCVCSKADYLFAKKRLATYCKQNSIDFAEYNTFYEVMNNDRIGLNVR